MEKPKITHLDVAEMKRLKWWIEHALYAAHADIEQVPAMLFYAKESMRILSHLAKEPEK